MHDHRLGEQESKDCFFFSSFTTLPHPSAFLPLTLLRGAPVGARRRRGHRQARPGIARCGPGWAGRRQVGSPRVFSALSPPPSWRCMRPAPRGPPRRPLHPISREAGSGRCARSHRCHGERGSLSFVCLRSSPRCASLASPSLFFG